MSVFHASSARFLLAGALILGGPAMLAACSSSNSSSDSTQASNEQAVSLNVDTPRISVLSLGQDPKTSFSYTASSDFSESVKISTGFSQFTTQDSVDGTAPAGGDVNTLSATVASKATDGTSASFSFNDMTYSQLSMNNNLSTANGFSLGWDNDPTGLIRTVRLAAPVGASDEGRQLLETSLMKFISLPVIFPSDPIGVGASWTVDSKVPGATSTLQTVTYTLNSIEDGTLGIGVKVEQRPSVGALDLSTDTDSAAPSTTAGELKVLSSNTTSEGNLTVDLSRPIPTAGDVKFTTRVVYGTDSSAVRVVQDSTTAIQYGQ
ncbi:MAG: DUF6263 family protein [Corynebacterium sp.]|nr:DUF6263 family protein [Corynebacterium sp.]